MIETLGTIILWLVAIVGIVGGALLWLIDGEASRQMGDRQSFFPKGMVAVGIALVALLLTGCVTAPPVYGDVPECERMIPSSLLAPVEGVPLPEKRLHPDGHEDAEPGLAAYIGQTGQLDKANDKPGAVDHIYRTCLVLHREALARAKRGFFGRLFGR